MNEWLGFDSLCVLLTPGFVMSCKAECDRFSTILSIKRRESRHNNSSTSTSLSLSLSIKASCGSDFLRNWLEIALHGSNAQAIV